MVSGSLTPKEDPMILNPVRAWRNHRVACEIAAAAIDFAATSYDGMTTNAASFTCQEADTFAAMLRAMHWPDEFPDRFMDDHARGDDDPEDWHHERHLALIAGEAVSAMADDDLYCPACPAHGFTRATLDVHKVTAHADIEWVQPTVLGVPIKGDDL